MKKILLLAAIIGFSVNGTIANKNLIEKVNPVSDFQLKLVLTAKEIAEGGFNKTFDFSIDGFNLTYTVQVEDKDKNKNFNESGTIELTSDEWEHIKNLIARNKLANNYTKVYDKKDGRVNYSASSNIKIDGTKADISINGQTESIKEDIVFKNLNIIKSYIVSILKERQTKK